MISKADDFSFNFAQMANRKLLIWKLCMFSSPVSFIMQLSMLPLQFG